MIINKILNILIKSGIPSVSLTTLSIYTLNMTKY